jgi:hypothetical protein
LTGPRGLWSDYCAKYKKMTAFRVSDCYKGVMADKESNGFKYIQNELLEKKVFSVVENQRCKDKEMNKVSK